MVTKTKSKKKKNLKTYEQEIVGKFLQVDAYEDFLLDEVGVVVEKNSLGQVPLPGKKYGYVATGDGTVLSYVYGPGSTVHRYTQDDDGGRILVPVQKPLDISVPVTFSRRKDKWHWVNQVVQWCPDDFEKIIGAGTLYRFVECAPKFGKLYRAGHSEPRIIETLWEGTNLESLRKLFPKDRWVARTVGAKPCHFERRDNGRWLLSEDPR